MSDQIVEGIPNDELGAKIGWEGFDYFFLDYISPDKLNDIILQGEVRRLQDTRQRIEKRLNDYGVVIEEA